MKVLLKYGFIFEPADTWSQMSQFETILGRFFKEVGLQAELIKSASGQEEIRIIYLSPGEKPEPTKVNSTEIDKARGVK